MIVHTHCLVDRRRPSSCRRSTPVAPRYWRPPWGRTPTSTWQAATRQRPQPAPARRHGPDEDSGRLDATWPLLMQRRLEYSWDDRQEQPCRRDGLWRPPTTPLQIRCVRWLVEIISALLTSKSIDRCMLITATATTQFYRFRWLSIRENWRQNVLENTKIDSYIPWRHDEEIQ